MSDAASEAAAAALVVGPESAPVPLADVETELNQRIRDLQEGTAEIVLRARMSNVVIYCNTLQQTEEINQLIPDILALHPARVLLLYGQAEGAASVLTTTVSVVAHTVRDGQKLCSEQINVRAPPALFPGGSSRSCPRRTHRRWRASSGREHAGVALTGRESP